MVTSDERRDAADALRRMANDSMHGLSFQNAIKECVCDRDEGSVSWRGVMRRLADLIDPTCADVHDNSYKRDADKAAYCAFKCSACGHERLMTDMVREATLYCPHCGARVVGHRE